MLIQMGLAVAVVVAMVGGCLRPDANRPPIAIFDASPTEGYTPLVVYLNASSSYDPDGDLLGFEWAFGDGETGNGRATVHTYNEGTYTVTLRAVDTHGAGGTATAAITARVVPDGYVLRRFEWIYNEEAQYWDVLIPYDLYQTYRGRIRSPFVETYAYEDFVLDPLDDPTLGDLAEVLWNRSGGTVEAFIECTLAFVQAVIAYRPDPPETEWPLYPIETLVDGVGDCEDTAVLFVSLLRARGVSSRLAFVDTDEDLTPDHVLVLVPVSETYAEAVECSEGQAVSALTLDDGCLLVVAETAAEFGPVPLGCDVWGLDVADVAETWSF